MAEFKKVVFALAGVSMAAALLTGCAENVHDSGAGEGPSATQPTMTAAPGPDDAPVERAEAEQSMQHLIAAGTLAEQKVTNSAVVTITAAHTGHFIVIVATPDGAEQSMTVSPDGDKILSGPSVVTQSDAQIDQTQQNLQDAGAEFSDAARNALPAVPGGTLRSLRLQRDVSSEQLFWKATLVTELGGTVHVTLSAVTGQVTHTSLLG